MKILALQLTAFGPFDGVRLDLSQGNHGLHMIYGPNEAGKSSALRALRQVFFGIPVRSSDNFRHPHNQMRIGANIRHSDGEILNFIRRKGNSNTLRAADDENIIDDQVLARFFKGMDADLFSTMFGIDHGDLVRGGREIIHGNGNLGQIIFAAGSGITSLRNIQADLQQRADALFKPAGKVPRINDAILRVKDSRKRLKDVQLASGDWMRHDQAHEEALKSMHRVEQELARSRTEKNHLERIREALPMAAHRNALMDALKPYASAVLLPADFGSLRRDHIAKLRIAENEQARAADNIRQLQHEINHLHVSKPVLENSDAIEGIYRELGGYAKAARDRMALQTRRDILRSEATQILKTLRDDLTIDDAEQLRLSKKDTLHIQEMGSRYERIVALIDSSRKEIPGLAHQISEIDKSLSALKPSRSMDGLCHALDRAAEYISVEKQCAEEMTEYQLAEHSLEIELGRQSLWSGSLHALERLAIPSEATIAVFEGNFDAAERDIHASDKEIRKLEAGLSDTLKRTEELTRNYAVPTEADLLSAREKRDTAWRQIAGKLIARPDSDPHPEDFPKSDPDVSDLCAGFENSVTVADKIADRLRREADRVAILAKLISDKEDMEQKLVSAREARRALETARKQLASEWAGIWAPAGITPASPREMRQWAAGKRDMAARFADIRTRKARTESRQKFIDDLNIQLVQAFTAISEPLSAECRTLNDRVRKGRQVVETESTLSDRREKLESEKAQKTKLLTDLKVRAKDSETDLIRWQQKWEQAVAPLGLDADSLPAHAGMLMEDLKHLFDTLKEADVLHKRISGIDCDADDFNSRVDLLVKLLSPHLAGQPADKAAAEISRCLKKTQTAYSKMQTLENQINKENLSIRQSARTIAEMEAVLKTMCEEAGCADYKDLPEAENRSAKRRELASELTAVEAQLMKLSAGSQVEDFISECRSTDPDSLESKISHLSETIDRLTIEKSRLDQTIGSERTELERMDGSAHAANLAEEIQSLLGGMEKDIEDYARYKIGNAVLTYAIERFRDKNQSPVLRKAGAFFSQITDGSFEGIRAEFDDAGNPVIVGVRKTGREIVGIEAMSEGTADQLYLSLRLAGLDEYLDRNEALPFIVDDILIKFDDARATTTLAALAGLSEKTQIIFFTHHRHLVELAEKHIDPSVLIRHNLRA